MAMDGKHLSLAYRDLEHIPVEVVDDYFDRVEELDLSYNKFSELRTLASFTELTTLVLDHNQLTSHVKFPTLPRLEILWVNHNNITNLPIFIESLAKCFPRLRYLSMMNNEAAPSYFNGGSYERYEDYRWYVISHFPRLESLDDTAVTATERQAAEKVYGKAYAAGRKSRNATQRTSSRSSTKSQQVKETS